MTGESNYDDDEILTGQDAIDHMVDTWQDIGQGMVNAAAEGPWFIVRRGGGDYSCFLSLVDGTAVTILDNNAEADDIPEDLRPDADSTEEQREMVARAFAGTSGGMFPLPGDDVFGVSYKDDDGGYKQLGIGLLDDTLRVSEE